MSRDATPAFVMFPLALLAATALLLDCFTTGLPGPDRGVAGVSGAPALWLAVAFAVLIALAAGRIILRDRRGRRASAGDLWMIVSIAVVGLAIVLTAVAGWSTGQIVATGVADPPPIALEPDRLLYLAAGALSAIAASACGWLRMLVDERDPTVTVHQVR